MSLNVFRHITGSQKNIFLTKVKTYDVTNNVHARELAADRFCGYTQPKPHL